MRMFLFALVAGLIVSPVQVMAGTDSYEAVKEETKNTGHVGFEKRKDAFRDHIMNSRRSGNAADLSDIAPAAGEASGKGKEASAKAKTDK